MPGKPFQSKLDPHLELIRSLRQKRRTWDEICAALAPLGVITDKGNLHRFFKRRLRRPYPLGVGPEPEHSHPNETLAEELAPKVSRSVERRQAALEKLQNTKTIEKKKFTFAPPSEGESFEKSFNPETI